jgi:hypothetical protein
MPAPAVDQTMAFFLAQQNTADPAALAELLQAEKVTPAIGRDLRAKRDRRGHPLSRTRTRQRKGHLSLRRPRSDSRRFGERMGSSHDCIGAELHVSEVSQTFYKIRRFVRI